MQTNVASLFLARVPLGWAFLGMIVLIIVLLPTGARAQVCNPVIDGTYCATQMPKNRASTTYAPSSATVRSIGGDVYVGQDQPATLGAITFRGGGERCAILLRRGDCN